MRHPVTYIVLLVALLSACRNKEEHGDHETNADTLQIITSSTDKLVSSAQETVKPVMISKASSVKHRGVLTPDERRNNIISVKSAGRIEKLYIKYQYKQIRKGEPVLEIYSPEINTASEEYLTLLKAGEQTLINKAREKLKLLGVTENQITKLENSRKVPHTTTVYSEYTGFVFPAENKSSEPSSAEPGNQDMNNMSQPPGQPADMSSSGELGEGAYVARGQSLFVVNDLDILWARITIDPHQTITRGDSLLIRTEDRTIKAVAGFIEPYYEKDQQFSRARINIKNEGQLFKVNELVTAEKLESEAEEFLAVPDESILDLGQRKVVWVKEGSIGKNHLFRARPVTTGAAVNGFVEIISGLTKDDEIAKTAGYLIDAETLMGR